MSRVYVGIGSNLGDRLANLRGCVSELEEAEGLIVVAVSSAYNSQAVGLTGQPDFLNGVVVVDTELSPGEFLALLNRIEEKYGRTRDLHWGPRTLDADILLYDMIVVDEPDLKIPHPLLAERRFVLEPLLELAPDLSLPDGTPLGDRLRELGDEQAVSREGGI